MDTDYAEKGHVERKSGKKGEKCGNTGFLSPQAVEKSVDNVEEMGGYCGLRGGAVRETVPVLLPRSPVPSPVRFPEWFCA